MLGLVFWNARRPSASRADYASALCDFHRHLNDDKPAGFRFSVTFRLERLPWLSSASEIFEDWYVLRDFATIDALDAAVLERPDLGSHRFLMRTVGRASGAVYSFARGRPQIRDYAYANWFSKPSSINVDGVLEQLADGPTSSRYALWARSLALGPAPHCLLTEVPLMLPSEFQSYACRRQRIWPA